MLDCLCLACGRPESVWHVGERSHKGRPGGVEVERNLCVAVLVADVYVPVLEVGTGHHAPRDLQRTQTTSVAVVQDLVCLGATQLTTSGPGGSDPADGIRFHRM